MSPWCENSCTYRGFRRRGGFLRFQLCYSIKTSKLFPIQTCHPQVAGVHRHCHHDGMHATRGSSYMSNCQFVEIFSGKARTARLASWSGYKSKAVDFIYSKSMNLLRPSGLVFLSCLSFLSPNLVNNINCSSPTWA